MPYDPRANLYHSTDYWQKSVLVHTRYTNRFSFPAFNEVPDCAEQQGVIHAVTLYLLSVSLDDDLHSSVFLLYSSVFTFSMSQTQ